MSAALTAAINALSEVLESAEDALADTFRGITADVPLGDTGQRLRFDKHGKAWRLLVVSAGSTEAVPLVNASAALRVVCVRVLPALHAELNVRSHMRVTEINDAVDAVRAFVDTLPGRDP